MLISTQILTERFCCDLDACGGACCVEGDAGAPVTLDEVGEIEAALDAAWPYMSATAQSVVDRQGVAYTDVEGDLVTSIVNGKDCVFTFYEQVSGSKFQVSGSKFQVSGSKFQASGANGQESRAKSQEPAAKACCLCALEAACRAGKSCFMKPISCALYPIREKRFSGGLVGLNYHRWAICEGARKRGQELNLPLYRFLREPLIRRFGEAWYNELCEVAALLG